MPDLATFPPGTRVAVSYAGGFGAQPTHTQGVVVDEPVTLRNGWPVFVEFDCDCWGDDRPHRLGFNEDEVSAL